MNKDCHQYATLITGFIDGELDEETGHLVKQHLNECQRCHENYAQEQQIKRLVSERVQMQRAPAYLQNRIRRQLIREGDRPGFFEIVRSLFVYRPVAASLTLAIIGVLVVLPMYLWSSASQSHLDVPHLATEETALTGELIGEVFCLDCEFLARYSANLQHDPQTHRPALRCQDGIIWTCLQSKTTQRLFQEPNAFKKKTVVSGVLFTKSHYVIVEDYELL